LPPGCCYTCADKPVLLGLNPHRQVLPAELRLLGASVRSQYAAYSRRRLAMGPHVFRAMLVVVGSLRQLLRLLRQPSRYGRRRGLGLCVWFGDSGWCFDRRGGRNSLLPRTMRTVPRGLLLHNNARAGHARNVMTRWHRDVPEPAWRRCALGRLLRAWGVRWSLGIGERKFGCGFWRRLRARYDQRTAGREDGRASQSEPPGKFHIGPPPISKSAFSASVSWPSLTHH